MDILGNFADGILGIFFCYFVGGNQVKYYSFYFCVDFVILMLMKVDVINFLCYIYRYLWK